MAAASNQIVTSTPNASNVYRPSDILRQLSSTPIAQNGVVDGNKPSPVARRQLRRSINASAQRYECGYCAQTFKVESNLIYHEQVHRLNNHERKDRDEPFVCVVCGMRFELKAEMDRHREDHKEKVVKRCSYCNNKKYGNEEHLERHERIHEWINSLEEHEPFVCNEFELIYQSRAMDAPQNDLQSIGIIKVETQPENDGGKSQSDSDKSNDSNLITISISSDSDSNVDDNPAGLKNEFMAKDQVVDSTSAGLEFVQQTIGPNKQNFKCAHCELAFEQSYDKLMHECQFHTPSVVLTKGSVEAITDTAAMSVDVDVPLDSSVPESSQNQNKISKLKQKPIDRMKQKKKDDKLEQHSGENTTDQMKVADSGPMTRSRCTIVLTETKVPSLQHQPIENKYKCTFCDLTFAQIDEQLKHECQAHSLGIWLRKVEDDATTSSGTIKTHTEQSPEPKDDENLPKNDDVECKEVENYEPIELDIDVRPDSVEKRNDNKRKRSIDKSGRSSTGDSGKRTRLATNPVVIEQQANNNSTTVNDINLEFSDVPTQKSIVGRKSKENVQQLQKEPQPRQQQQQNQQPQQQLQEERSAVGRVTRGFWKKQFLGIDARQLTIVAVPTPRRMPTKLTLTGLIDMNISD